MGEGLRLRLPLTPSRSPLHSSQVDRFWERRQLFLKTGENGQHLIQHRDDGVELRLRGAEGTFTYTQHTNATPLVVASLLPARSSPLDRCRWTDFGSTLGRYWAAEGISNGQQLVVVDFEDMYDEEDRQNCAKGFLSSLPLDMNFAKKERREQQQQQQQQQQLDAESSSSAVQQPSLSLAEISLAEGNEDDEEDDFEEVRERERERERGQK